MLKVATWNVNSLRVRLNHVLNWLTTNQPDILALQETKINDDQFPIDEFHKIGYEVSYSGQKTYNGVATLSRFPITTLGVDLHDYTDDQRRLLITQINGITVLNIYVPNGSSLESEKYSYKLDWLNHLQQTIATLLQETEQLIVLGDFNIAPTDEDVHDPRIWQNNILVSPAERQAFQALLDLGLKDSIRLFEQKNDCFSWWDYRAGSFEQNHGLRIDHILVSEALAYVCYEARVDTMPRALERPSDHTPVVCDFNIVAYD